MWVRRARVRGGREGVCTTASTPQAQGHLRRRRVREQGRRKLGRSAAQSSPASAASASHTPPPTPTRPAPSTQQRRQAPRAHLCPVHVLVAQALPGGRRRQLHARGGGGGAAARARRVRRQRAQPQGGRAAGGQAGVQGAHQLRHAQRHTLRHLSAGGHDACQVGCHAGGQRAQLARGCHVSATSGGAEGGARRRRQQHQSGWCRLGGCVALALAGAGQVRLALQAKGGAHEPTVSLTAGQASRRIYNDRLRSSGGSGGSSSGSGSGSSAPAPSFRQCTCHVRTGTRRSRPAGAGVVSISG